jgi:hypothetical protein
LQEASAALAVLVQSKGTADDERRPSFARRTDDPRHRAPPFPGGARPADPVAAPPHDPRWFAESQPFPDPAQLFVAPDHYLFRMLYSQGVALEDVDVPRIDGGPVDADPR